MKTMLLLDHGPSGGSAWSVRALLRLEADTPTRKDRLPLNIGLVLDRSGSMAGAKLAALRDAAATLVRRLAPEDTVSVVAYDDEVVTVAKARRVGEATALLQQIEAIVSGGSTNLSGGWLRGREQIFDARGERTVNRVLLLTDGLANLGIMDSPTLCGLTAQARTQGITTTTIGFGADYDEQLLREMAEAGGGRTYYIESPDQAPSIFAHEIEGLLGVAAQNMSVRVQPVDARLVTMHHAYELTNDGAGVRFELGDLYSTEPRSLLLEFLLETPAPDLEATVAEVTVRSTCVGEDGSLQLENIRIPIRVSLADGPRADPEVQREVLLLQAARAREEALRARDRGDLSSAAAVLRVAARTMREAGLADESIERDAQDLAAMAESEFTAADAKYLHQVAYDRSRSLHSKADLIERKK